MKSFKAAILGSLVGGSLLLFSVPSQAAPWGGRFNHRTLGNDIRNDRAEIQGERRDLYTDHRDLTQDRRELRQDRRDGASPERSPAIGRTSAKIGVILRTTATTSTKSDGI
jgi:hypothetical protein